MRLFHKIARSKINGFEYKFWPKKTATLIEALILGVSLMSIFLVSDWTFRHIGRNVGNVLLIIVAIIGLYWISTDSGRKKHYYCNKALISIESWMNIWQKAGVPQNDPVINEIESKADFLKKHIDGSNKNAICGLPISFYAETKKLISELNLRTFEEVLT